MNPLVSVLIAAQNSEAFIDKAINSVRQGSLEDFEILVAFDRSSDRSREIVDGISERDSRVKVIADGPLGFPRVRDVLLEAASGRYAAILDSDDVAAPERLALQVKFLDENPDIGVVGSWCRTIDASGERVSQWRMPVTHPEIADTLRGRNAIVHSSAVFRSDLRELGLRYVGPPGEDFLLWLRLLHRGVQFHNLPEYLVDYRLNPAGLSSSLQSRRALALRLNALACAQLEVENAASETLMEHIMSRDVLFEESPHARHEELAQIWNRPEETDLTERSRLKWRKALLRGVRARVIRRRGPSA